MTFNSLTFLVFFAVVFAVHSLPLSWRLRKLNLLLASYLFYAAWNPPFVILLWLSTAVDWFAARGIAAATGRWARRAWLATSLATGLGLLAYFKYGGFLLESSVALLATLGINFQPAAPDIVLPVGISFYTFQTLSYTIDVYRRDMRPWPSFLDYALYVAFFPQLVAGPIVRARQWLPQCREPRRASPSQLGRGVTLLALGLFQKAVLADGVLAPVADRVYASPAQADFLAGWIGTLAFSGQIFFDFAGYSTCALGAAACLGFWLPENFRQPYAALGFSDFWRRWHISLSTWLRDYLYRPLGGSRRGEGRTYANLLLTMLIGGLWHGAAWHFVAWGGLHGLLLAAERPLRGSIQASSGAMRLFWMGTTYIGVCLAWVLFRAPSLGDAGTLLRAMLLGGGGGGVAISDLERASVLLVTAGLLAVHAASRELDVEGFLARIPWWLRAPALATLLLGLAVAPGENRAFIYFQF